jgi:hypothetical protein
MALDSDPNDRPELVRRLEQLHRATKDLIARSEKTIQQAKVIADSVERLKPPEELLPKG